MLCPDVKTAVKKLPRDALSAFLKYQTMVAGRAMHKAYPFFLFRAMASFSFSFAGLQSGLISRARDFLLVD